ncbi:MAG: prenyltransferase [Candidatus Rokubacteria bacterium]|nr:prenyltransferase [Candidatus Rokubacteria bacterium]
MRAQEPTLEALPNPLLRYFLATRPPFLTVTLFACLIGLAGAYHTGAGVDPATAAATLALALVAHAGVNVLNDYYDALNGTDAINTERVFPYTGGSRFIQNGVLTLRETGLFGAALFAVVVPAGLWLASKSGAGLVLIGALGLLIGWAYSAPPLELNSRGIGEACVAAGFALIAIGTDYVQRAEFSMFPVIAAAPYAVLVTNILYINQFPDLKADAASGKRHWVVRLGARHARWGYLALAALAYSWLIGAVLLSALPPLALAALVAALPSIRAARILLRHAEQADKLAPAIRTTIAAAALHGTVLSAALVLSAPAIV